MKISVRSYGAMGDMVGKTTNLEIHEGARISDLTHMLVTQFPKAQGLMPSCCFAISNQFASIDTELKPDQEVSILPPASGG
ncbi:MAG: MoaD/ThiS family protein [Spirochaetia bacterium]|nr:MoaD/ThiS family protein [Spirochaetia bacterium]